MILKVLIETFSDLINRDFRFNINIILDISVRRANFRSFQLGAKTFPEIP